MRVFILFELFLVLFTFYAIFKFEGGIRILVPILCLVAVFLFERLRRRPKQDEKAKKRPLKHDYTKYQQYSIEGNNRRKQPERWDE